MKISFPELQFHRPEILKEYIKKPKDSPAAAADPNMEKDKELYAIGRGNRHRVLGKWVTRTRQTGHDPVIRNLVQSMLASPEAGAVPEFKEDTWAVMCEFDARRQRKENCATMIGNKTFQQVRNIAADSKHPRHADAKLLADIMTRPLGKNPESLESYLSGLVSKQVRETINKDFNTTPEYNNFAEDTDIALFVKTFTGIMLGVALNSQDYTAAGRALILKGATHLSAWSDPPPAKPGNNTETPPKDALARRLRQAAFCFPTEPEEGKNKLMLVDFSVPVDPLETLFGEEFYLNANMYHVMEKTKAA